MFQSQLKSLRKTAAGLQIQGLNEALNVHLDNQYDVGSVDLAAIDDYTETDNLHAINAISGYSPGPSTSRPSKRGRFEAEELLHNKLANMASSSRSSLSHDLIAEPVDDISQVFLPEPEVKMEPIDADYMPDDEEQLKQPDWTAAMQQNYSYLAVQPTMTMGGKRYSTTSAILVR